MLLIVLLVFFCVSDVLALAHEGHDCFGSPLSVEDYTYAGKCPDYFKPVENFDVKKFTEGRWFLYSFHNKQRQWGETEKCPEIQFFYFPEKQPQELIYEYYYVNPVSRCGHWMNYTAEYNPDKPGHVSYPKEVADKAGPAEFWKKAGKSAVEIDYEHYGAFWGCFNIPDQDRHYENVVVYSRTRGYLAPEYYNKLQAYFERHTSIKFQQFLWDDCRVDCDSKKHDH